MKDQLREAQELVKSGDYQEALQILKALYQKEQSLTTIMAYSHTLVLAGQTNEAGLILQEGDQKFPNEPNIHHNLGFMFMRQEEWEKALQVYEQLYSQGLRSEASMWNLGICLMRVKNFKAAKTILTETVQIYPNTIEAKIDLAVCYFENKDLEPAKILIQEVLNVQSDHPRASAILYEIEKDEAGKSARFYEGDKEED